MDVQGMYYKNQSILYIAEGDFSYSSSQATQFGHANNIVATSLDSRDILKKNYGMDAIQNIKNLTDRGAQVIHHVNASNMAEKNESLPLFASGRLLYDVVNCNFPHAGFFGLSEEHPKVIRKHTKLMKGFFKNAALLLAPGGVIYVAHKCGPGYDSWNLEENANMHGLELIGCIPFQKSNFPGYINRRGSGKKAGDTFELGKAVFYTFALRCRVWIDNIEEIPLHTTDKELFLLQTFRSYSKRGRASLKTQLLHDIPAEVARLEKLELGPKKQRKLKSLKLVLRMVPLLVKTFAIHRIRHLQASCSFKVTAQSWSKMQKPAIEAMEDEQNIDHEKLELHPLLVLPARALPPQPVINQLPRPSLFEPNTCTRIGRNQHWQPIALKISGTTDNCPRLRTSGQISKRSTHATYTSSEIHNSGIKGLMKEEHEAMEICVSDDIAHGALDDVENEDLFGAFLRDPPVLSKQSSHAISSDLTCHTSPENRNSSVKGLMTEELEVMEICASDDTADGALDDAENEDLFCAFLLDPPVVCAMDTPEDIHMKTAGGIDHHIIRTSYQGNKYFRPEYQSSDDMPYLQASSGDMEAVEDKGDGLEVNCLGIGIIHWVVKSISCFGMS